VTNRLRRAIRDFEPTGLPEQDVRAVLDEALLAPSSGNLQPYQLHWVREPGLKARVAQQCSAQRAATSAPVLVVVVADPRLGRRTAEEQLAHVEGSPALSEKSKAYHRAQARKFLKLLAFGRWLLWSPLRALLAALNPVHSLLPIGSSGSRNWAARSAVYAAQTLMLAAAAKGIDSCPMEGFSAPRVARLLGLPRGAVIPVIIALGYRTGDARVEPQWRRKAGEAVVEHCAA
jgi:nitroreductase